MQERKKILILIDWFLPGIKAGGPVKSISSIINILHKYYEFYILTGDRDFGDTAPYPTIKTDQWIPFNDHVHVLYSSNASTASDHFLNALKQIEPDIIYINSFFSKNYSILPLQLIKKHQIKTKTILAPRGMLSAGALKIKPLKKKIFMAYAKLIGLHNGLVWHSTKTEETKDIKHFFGDNAVIHEAQNLSDIELCEPDLRKTKLTGELKLIYLGRIAENKNLSLVLKALRNMNSGTISLDIYGNKEDISYWETCSQQIVNLPSNISVSYKGVLNAKDISNTLRSYHFLIQLSYSENFGHSIVESLSSSVPVIISNTTPWLNLHMANAGWDVSIINENEAVSALQRALELNQSQYNEMAISAYNYASINCINQEVIDKLKLLFA